MSRDLNDNYLSELERELDLEMEDTLEPDLKEEFRVLRELEDEPLEEFEDIEEKDNYYAERFYELYTRTFESESEVDDAVSGLLGEMERDYFFKGLWKKLKKAGKNLIKKGLKFVKGLPIGQVVQGITQLARGNLKGLLGSLAKAGLSSVVSAIPGGAAILPALKTLGFETTEEPEENKEAWNNFVSVARESFDYLAKNLNENTDDPVEASRLANEAYRTALKKVSSFKSSIRNKDSNYRIIKMRKGDRVIITAE